jgi:GNAT superfamily N-acetyltransferase
MQEIDSLYKITRADINKTGTMLIDAFQYDPLWNKLVEGEEDIPTKLRAIFETPVRYSLYYGWVYAPSEQLEGVAAWVPGNRADMSFWRLLRSGGIISGFKMGAQLGDKMKKVFTLMEEDRREHMQRSSYIYLQIIGVAREYQGQGFGGILLRSLINECKKSGYSLYLETETEENVAMYEHFGFRMIKKTTLPVIDLPVWEMVREPV